MSLIREAIVVDAPVDEVWHVIADARNLPRWNSHIREVRGAPDRELKEGDSYRLRLRFMGVSAEVRAEVMELEAERFAKVRLSGVVTATIETFVKAIGRGRSRVEHVVDYHFPGGALGELAARTVRLLGAPVILRRGLRAQKQQVEQG